MSANASDSASGGHSATISPHGSNTAERPQYFAVPPGRRSSPHWFTAATKNWFSIARARHSTRQCSERGWGNAAQITASFAPARAEADEKLRKAQIVADGETYFSERGVGNDGFAPRPDMPVFAEHSEEVDFVVVRYLRAVGAHEAKPVARAALRPAQMCGTEPAAAMEFSRAIRDISISMARGLLSRNSAFFL